MMIAPIQMNYIGISFLGKRRLNPDNPDLKTLWDTGKLSKVKYGFYGDRLTQDNVSREHLLPKSLGGTTKFGNIVLASKQNNSMRGNRPIAWYIDLTAAKRYLKQFENMKIPIDGNRYIQAVKNTLKFLGIKL